MSYTEDRSAVKRLTKQIEKADADADAWKWERAERLARMCETRTQRDVASDVGMNKSTVADIVRVHAARVPGQTYTAAYYEAVGAGGSAKFGKGGGRNAKEKAATVREALTDDAVMELVLKDRDIRDAIEATMYAKAPTPSGTHHEVEGGSVAAALYALTKAHTEARRANNAADHAALSEHEEANAEVVIRATESEFAIWRENAGGGITDEAIREFMEAEDAR